MPVDPEVQPILDQVNALEIDLAALTLEDARKFVEAAMVELGSDGTDIAKETDLVIPGPGGALAARAYRPHGAGPFPVVVYFHGGGWVTGTLATHDGTCRDLAAAAEAVVVAVDYRRAPEHRFPAASDDALAAVTWIATNASTFDGTPGLLAVGGDSAGGNLSAVTALRCRDQGGPELSFQLLVYPVTDHRFDTSSYLENATGYLLTRKDMLWFWDQYVPDPSDRDDPYASPLRAADLSGLPPALVITAELDPLRDEGEAYAERLASFGVIARASRYDGVIHGFFSMSSTVSKGADAIAEAGDALRQAFAAAARQ